MSVILKKAGEEKKSFLSLQNLVKVYPNGEKAVYGFNLEIEKNEFIVVVGPSGCGKSTTLRMIAGLEDISSGDIFLEDELLNYRPSKDRHMAIVFQSYALYPQMSIFENIAFPLTINKFDMPVVNTVLRACEEINNSLEQLGYERFVEIVFRILHGKGKSSDKQEKLSLLLNISVESVPIITEFFTNYKHTPYEDILSLREEITSKLKAELNSRGEEERRKLAEENRLVNESHHELDSNGAEKRVKRKLTAFEIKTKVYETAKLLNLAAYLDKRPKELSGGQMQRVALGRAIVKNAPIFLMDEPLSNLDAKLRLTMRTEIVKLHNRINATTIYVTHDQTEAMTMASRIVIMSKGFVEQIGTPAEIYNNPANLFVARFIGAPPMNFLEMSYNKADNCLELGDIQVSLGIDFADIYDNFYQRKIAELESLGANFDNTARERLLKVISATGESFDTRVVNNERKTIWDKLKKIKKQSDNSQYNFRLEKEILDNKLVELRNYTSLQHKLMVGIRPERLNVEKVKKGKKYTNAFVVRPTVCELLGGEYNIHFDYLDKNIITKMDAKQEISVHDDIAVWFSEEDIYIFDAITGDRIK